MRPTTLLSALLAGGYATAAASSLTIPVHIQPITLPPSAPILLAEITHNPSPSPDSDSDDTPTRVTSYTPPSLPPSAHLVRIGAYDAHTRQWTSSVSVASAENFGKGYSPHFVVNLGGDKGEEVVVGVVVRGVRVDAGYTRDFGPQVEVVRQGEGGQVRVNQPVVLSPEGKKVVVEEKSMIQKYVVSVSLSLCGGLDGDWVDANSGIGTGGCWRLGRLLFFRGVGMGSRRGDARRVYNSWGLADSRGVSSRDVICSGLWVSCSRDVAVVL